jgi:C4-dicarboxylate transporter DctM subunit
MGFSNAIILIVLFTVCVLSGIPIAFSISFPAIIVMLMNNIEPMVAPQMFINGPMNFTLLAVPFFILAGNIMNKAGVSKRIFDFCLALVGRVRGSLGYVNVLASMVFAGISGSAMADAVGLGKVEMKAMQDAGYDKDFSAAITAASSIIGPIIPPSIAMVIYASIGQLSAGDMFKAGFIPGIVIGVALMIAVWIMIIQGERVGKPIAFSLNNIFKAARNGALSMVAPLIILGGMFSGKFTPSEAGAIAVAYTVLLGFVYGELSITDIPELFKQSAIDSANCMFMTAGATLLGWVVAYSRIPVLLAEAVFAVTTSKYVFLLIVAIFVMFLGCLIEAIAGIIIIAPVLLPVALQFGINPIHFGIILCYGMMIGCITPPMAPVLFAVIGISDTKFEGVLKKTMPFLAAHIIALLLITYIPSISMWLPSIWK